MIAAKDAAVTGEQHFVPDAANLRAYRTALGQFTTGVTIVTVSSESGPQGMTVNSFASVSLEPPLVLWSPAKSSARHALFCGAAHFIVHVLGAEQDDLMGRFTRGGAGFAGIDWHPNEDGAPAISGTLARFECVRQSLHDAGDHTLVIGRVLRVAQREGDPLCFAQGRFGRFARMA